MQLRLKNKREVLGGGIIALSGIVGIAEGWRLGTGTLVHMAPGFLPMALGVLLLGLGIAMALQPSSSDEVILDRPEWLGWGCICLGVISFIILGQYAGLVIASFVCVVVAALGDRTATFKGALMLAAGVTVFGVALFHYILGITIPLFWW